MRICYVDEAGCTGRLPASNSPIQPVYVVAGVAVPQDGLPGLTRDFLALKRRFFPELSRGTNNHLDTVLIEVKGAKLRKRIRSESRRGRRYAVGFIDHLVRLIEQYDGRILGRVWVKGIGQDFNGRSVHTYSLQYVCETFQHYLASENQAGLIIADSQKKVQNTRVAHSVFTQKFRLAGDPYPRILEMPTFGHSDNHVGIQVADLLCSALLFPMATFSYCVGHVRSVHVNEAFGVLVDRFGHRLRSLQYRYRGEGGQWTGGLTVSDTIGGRNGGWMFDRAP